MATGSDQAVGYGMVTLAGAIFAYYTVWVIILPFADKDHFIHSLFLPRLYAILLPVSAGVIVLLLLGGFIGYIMMKKDSKKKVS